MQKRYAYISLNDSQIYRIWICLAQLPHGSHLLHTLYILAIIDWLFSIPILFTLTFAFNAYLLIYIFLRL